MTPSDEMRGLIERIEASSEGSREMDAAIYQMIKPHMLPTPGKLGHFYDPQKTGPLAAAKYHITGGATGFALFYTTRIDAAMTLLPGDDWEWSLEVQAGHLPGDDLERIVAIVKLGDPLRGWESTAATPALALCAAALKALSTMGVKGDG